MKLSPKLLPTPPPPPTLFASIVFAELLLLLLLLLPLALFAVDLEYAKYIIIEAIIKNMTKKLEL